MQTKSEYLQALATSFTARDKHGYVVGYYVYSGYVAGGSREAGPFPTQAEAAEWAEKVVEGHVICGHVFTASGKIVKDEAGSAEVAA